ncbi:MAG: hypothetical protein ACI4DP_00650 [Candidatus Ornithomonoglobus sp.]
MKAYIAPKMNINMFSAIDIVTTSGEPDNYVTALETVANKQQVNLADLKKVVEFTF